MAWWLLDSVINGTLDEDYPIMSEEKKSKYWYDYDRNDPNRKNPFKEDVTILGGDGDDTISFTGMDSLIGGADTVSVDWGGGQDHISFGTGSTEYNFYTSETENDVYAYHYPPTDDVTGIFEYPVDDSSKYFDDTQYVGSGSTASMVYGFPPKPRPDLKGASTQKYQEDKGIKDLKDYVSSTYQGHYTNDNSDVQTLDLIHSVGDAESFCRSNAIKYLSRYDKKGQAKRDILKAMHYCLLLYYFSGQTNDEITTRGYETF